MVMTGKKPGVVQLVAGLPSRHEALGSIPANRHWVWCAAVFLEAEAGEAELKIILGYRVGLRTAWSTCL